MRWKIKKKMEMRRIRRHRGRKLKSVTHETPLICHMWKIKSLNVIKCRKYWLILLFLSSQIVWAILIKARNIKVSYLMHYYVTRSLVLTFQFYLFTLFYVIIRVIVILNIENNALPSLGVFQFLPLGEIQRGRNWEILCAVIEAPQIIYLCNSTLTSHNQTILWCLWLENQTTTRAHNFLLQAFSLASNKLQNNWNR